MNSIHQFHVLHTIHRNTGNTWILDHNKPKVENRTKPIHIFEWGEVTGHNGSLHILFSFDLPTPSAVNCRTLHCTAPQYTALKCYTLLCNALKQIASTAFLHFRGGKHLYRALEK